MPDRPIQEKTGGLIAFGLVIISLIITPFSTLDPINLPKFWVLIAFGFSLFFLICYGRRQIFSRNNIAVLLPPFSMILAMLITLLTSPAPIDQQLFGVSGRNTGLLSYFSLSLIYISVAIITNSNFAKKFMIASFIAFGVNALYAFTQSIGKDFIRWSNPYSPVIGTFGNPNFLSAFLAMGIALYLPFIFHKGTTLKFRLLAVVYSLVAFYSIIKSESQQGVIIVFFAILIIIFFFILAENVKKIYLFSFLISVFGILLCGIAGLLQKGPLSKILYTNSITYRGDYWHAGIEMTKDHPLFGVGLDSYGDWYRNSRTVAATLRRGAAVVADAAHNVFIDISATSGLFALCSYLALIFYALRSIYRISTRNKHFDPFFVGICACWFGYLAQSAISINNIGLAIWGWALPGLIVACERWINCKLTVNTPASIPTSKVKKLDFSAMVMIAGLFAGGIVGFFPFNANANFRFALESQNAELLYASAKKTPFDPERLNYAAGILNNLKLYKKSEELLRISIKVNPRNFNAWLGLYYSTTVPQEEKEKIIKVLKSLDPNNPDLKNS